MRKKGFTLIELLAVIIIFGIIIGIAVTGYSKYVISSKNKSYSIAENSLKSAATDAVSDCMTGNGKNREFCDNHNVLEEEYEYNLVYLDELIKDDYMDAIRNPYDTDTLCSDKSYVYISDRTKEGQTNKNLEYKVCLICGDYKSKDCLDNIEDSSNYNALCKVSYDSEGNIPYDYSWTDKDLYLNLSATGEFKYGISHYLYKIGSNKEKKVGATNNSATVTLKETIDNKKILVTAKDGLDNSATTYCGDSIKVDKTKIISANITGKLNIKKTDIRSGEWASEDVLLTVTANPKKVPSGYLYQWYKDGTKIGNETTSNTYVATVDGTYYAEVTNGLHNQKVTTNSFVVKIDRTKPTITAKSNPISLGNGDYSFINNVTYTFGISGGTASCNPAASRKTGSYSVTCIAVGNNKLSASTTFTARHSYAATYVSRSCPYDCKCGDKCTDWGTCNSCYIDYCGGSSACYGSCGDVYGGDHCCKVCCADPNPCCKHTEYRCETCYNDCSYYTCPNGGTLNGTTCYY